MGRKANTELVGKKYGRLTAIRITDNKKYGHIVWEFKCDCGNIVYTTMNLVKIGSVSSCGCKRKEEMRKNRYELSIENFNKDNLVENTRLDIIGKENSRKHNTTGRTGVNLVKSTVRYTSSIRFQGKRYHLGTFDTIEEAYKAREELKERLHNEFLRNLNIKDE